MVVYFAFWIPVSHLFQYIAFLSFRFAAVHYPRVFHDVTPFYSLVWILGQKALNKAFGFIWNVLPTFRF